MESRNLFALGLLFSVSATGTGDNASHVDCVVDYNLGNYPEALSSCSNAQFSMLDRQVSTFLLGEMYSFGKGVAKDEDTAFQYYLASAKAGYPPAQLVVGHYYSDTSNLDETLALRWYLKAGSENWNGAGYALVRASNLLVKMGRKYAGYKCLLASVQLGYEADPSTLGQLMGQAEKQKAEKEVREWLRNRKAAYIVDLGEAE